MIGSEFLKTIRKDFDPCFRYIVLARKSNEEEDIAFGDVAERIDTCGSAVLSRKFYRDHDSGLIALVIELQPHAPAAIDPALVSGKLPEDIVFYLYESHIRACGCKPE